MSGRRRIYLDAHKSDRSFKNYNFYKKMKKKKNSLETGGFLIFSDKSIYQHFNSHEWPLEYLE